MTPGPAYIAADPGELYWRYEVCPHPGAKVLILTIGDVAIIDQWGRSELGQYFKAWCPLPKRGSPPPDIRMASLWQRLRFAFYLIFQPRSI